MSCHTQKRPRIIRRIHCKPRAAAKEIGVDAAVAAVLSELDGIVEFKVKQGTAQEAFLSEKDVFTLQIICFGMNFGEHQTERKL